MNACHNRLRLILTLIISYNIQFSCGLEESYTSSSSDDDEPLNIIDSLSQILGSPFTYNGQAGQTFLNSVSQNLTTASDHAANDRVTWLNSVNSAIDDFIREFERQHAQASIRVDRRLKTADWPIMPDDGFSKRYRLDFSYRTPDQIEIHSSVIVTMPELGYLYGKGQELMLYDKEKYMFEVVIPRMYRSWPYEKHSPNFYATAQLGTLLVENLNDDSHIMKTNLLDSVEDCKLVFKTLAQFHALSVSQLDEVVYSNLDSLTPVDVWVSNALTGHVGMEMMTQYSERLSQLLPDSMRDEISNVIRNLASIVESTFTAARGVDGFAVVLQGNPTRKNVYFVLDEKTSRITGCKFFSFRTSHVGSPVLDLMVYLLSGVEFEVFRDGGDSLFEFYLEELHTSLAMFDNSREYNLSMLRADLKRYKSFFIYWLMSTVHLQWESNGPGPINLDQLVKNRMDVFESESYISFFRKWMNVLTSW